VVPSIKIVIRTADYGKSPVSHAAIRAISLPFLSLLILMELLIFVPTPKTPIKPTSRDDRLRIQTLYYIAGWTILDIFL